MKWTIEYLEEDGIVYSKLSGVMDWEQHRKWFTEAFEVARKHGSHKYLNDFLEMVPRFTVLQIDDLPKQLIEIGAGPEDRMAALHDPSAPHHSENVFLKNVASLKSITVRYFTSRDEAIAWLKSES